MTLRLTDAAEGDLAEIWAYLVLEASEAVAARFLSAIHAVINQLPTFPMMGANREQFAQGLRVTFHGAYAIYYTASASEQIISVSCMDRVMLPLSRNVADWTRFHDFPFVLRKNPQCEAR